MNIARYKVGDRVRLNQYYGAVQRGTLGTIKSITPGNARINSYDLATVAFDGRSEPIGVYVTRLDPVIPSSQPNPRATALAAIDELVAQRSEAEAESRKLRATLEAKQVQVEKLSRETHESATRLLSQSRIIRDLRAQAQVQSNVIRELQAVIDEADRAKATIQVGDLVHIVGRINSGNPGIGHQTYRALEVQDGKPSLVRFTGYDGKTDVEDTNHNGIGSRNWVSRYMWEKVSVS